MYFELKFRCNSIFASFAELQEVSPFLRGFFFLSENNDVNITHLLTTPQLLLCGNSDSLFPELMDIYIELQPRVSMALI